MTMNQDLDLAAQAFLVEDPFYEGWPIENVTETFAFQMFKVLWDANRVADDLEFEGFTEIAAALRVEFSDEVKIIRDRMADARNVTLRELGIIP